MIRAVLLVPILLLVTAASDSNLGRQKYKPIPGGATAILRFPKGNLHLSIKRGDTQYYGVQSGDTCNSARKLTIYGAGIGGNTTEASLPVDAGNRLRILATVQKQYDAGLQFERYETCTMIVAFTPIAGRAYAVTQQADATQADFCAISVRDETTHAPPVDVADLPPLQCRF